MRKPWIVLEPIQENPEDFWHRNAEFLSNLVEDYFGRPDWSGWLGRSTNSTSFHLSRHVVPPLHVVQRHMPRISLYWAFIGFFFAFTVLDC